MFGTLGAVLVGGANPLVRIIFVKSLGLFYGSDPQVMRDDAVYWATFMFIIAFAQILGDTASYWGFGVPGERVTVKLRKMFFEAILRQEIGWHDMPDNAAGKLCANLASDLNLIQGLTGEAMAAMCSCSAPWAAPSLLPSPLATGRLCSWRWPLCPS